MVATIATKSIASVANIETDVAKTARYTFGMLDEWLKKAMDFKNVSGAELGRQLTASLGRSIDRAAVSKMRKGERGIYADELLAISEITGFAPPPPKTDDADDGVPLVGRIGAGSKMILFSQGDDPRERVRAPEGATPETVAAEIDGTSLGELFDKWLVYYDRRQDPPSDDLIGRLCVVGLADGRVLVKKLRRGRRGKGYFDLHSNTEPPMYDEVVEWAARVKQMSPR
jgi:hypothetical protein